MGPKNAAKRIVLISGQLVCLTNANVPVSFVRRFIKEHEIGIGPKSYRRILAATAKLLRNQHKRTKLRTMKATKHILVSSMLAATISLTIGTAAAGDFSSDSGRALLQLVAQKPAAARCRSKAVAGLVFPDVLKAGFILAINGAKEFFSCTANLAAGTAL